MLLLVGWTLGAALAAQPPGAFLTRSFTPADGLVGLDVRALDLAAPGELLLGTEVGAFRFDGERFRALPSPVGGGSPVVQALHAFADGVLIQSESALWRVDPEGQVHVIDRTPQAFIHAAMADGPDGAPLVANSQGVYRIVGDQLEPAVPLEQAPEGWGPRAVVADETGLWIGGVGGLFRYEYGLLSRVSPAPVRALLADGEHLLVGREDGLFREDGAEILMHPSCFVTALARLSDGQVAAACGAGVRVGRPGGAWEAVDSTSGLPGPVALAVVGDGDGNLWIGSFGQGLTRLSSLDARLWGRETGLGGDRAFIRQSRRGGLLVGTLGAAFHLSPDLAVTPLDGSGGTDFFDLLEQRDGDLLSVYYAAIWRLQPGPPSRLEVDTHGASTAVELDDGSVWLIDHMRASMYQILPVSGQTMAIPEDLRDSQIVTPLDGPLLVAGREGIWRLEARGWTRLMDGPGRCDAGAVRQGGEDLWVVCSGGAWLRRDGSWEQVLTAPPGGMRDLLLADGEVWASSADRLTRLSPDRMEIGPAQGLPAVGFIRTGARGLAKVGAWLIAATDQGVLWIRPEGFEGSPTPPTPRIVSVSVRGKAVADLQRLAPEDNVLRVELGEDSLSDPSQISFRFQLDEAGWSEPFDDESFQLAGLPPGEHRLAVQVRRAGGPWSPEPAALSLHLRPAWHQRREVIGGAIGAVLLGVALVAVERARRLRAELRHLREQASLRDTFGRFVAHEVADEVLSGRLKAEGESREVTVLFADIRGFTPLSESLPATDVVALLNTWFTAMVAEIEAEGGSVNKFMGDAVVAVFGAPRGLPDHADRALRAATRMVRAAERLDVPLRARFGRSVRAGIGVNSGVVVAGPVGAPNRMEYGVYGEPVNIAARIESLTRTLNAEVLVTDATQHLLRAPFQLSLVGPQPLKGVAHPVVVWKLEVPPLGDEVLQAQIREARRKRDELRG